MPSSSPWLMQKVASAVSWLFVACLILTSGMLLLFFEQVSLKEAEAVAIILLTPLLTAALIFTAIRIEKKEKKKGVCAEPSIPAD